MIEGKKVHKPLGERLIEQNKAHMKRKGEQQTREIIEGNFAVMRCPGGESV